MSKIGVSLKIDVSKIDKARLFKGEKGTYLDLTMFIDPANPSQYGDHGTISQSVSKEEREQGVQTPILGNGKVFYQEGGQQAPAQQFQQQAPQQQAPPASDMNDDIPF
jgi:hypothetical protein